MALPVITVIGRLTADPTLRSTNSGKYVTTLRIACNDRKKDEAGNWVDGDSLFIDVTVWRGAEDVSKLSKGTKIVAYGTLKQRTYEKDGQQRTAYEVVADFVGKEFADQNGKPMMFTTVVEPPATSDPWTTPPAAAPLDDVAPF